MPLFGFTNVSGSVITQTSVAIAQGTDADAQAFIDAASITDSTQISAVNQLVLDLKSYGVWDKCLAIYPIVGGSASSHAVNLKTPGTYNLTFATGVTHSSTGMAGDGASGYANTSLNPQSLISATNHLSFYSRTLSVNTEIEMGIYNNDGSGSMNHLRVAANYISGNGATSTGIVNFTTTTDAKGYWLGTKRASNDREVYLNGISQNTSNNTDSLLMPNGNIFLLARNQINPNATQFYSTKQCAFASIGTGLTDTEAANFYTAVQAYQTTLSRNV